MSFEFKPMIEGLAKYVENVKGYLANLEQATQGAMQLTAMFSLQFNMELFSQYVEAVSNVLAAANNEMITMARATKGQ